MKTIYKHYQDILIEKENYYYNPEDNEIIYIEKIFESGESKKFITNYFNSNGKGDLITWLMEHDLFTIDDFRSNHTVSAYLLGIIIRDKLKLNMASLPHLEKKHRDNFMYFWSFSCLFHDAAYVLENQSIDYLDDCQNIESLLKLFKIKYNLLEFIENNERELIENYFRYRVSKNKIDHGISGALFLFNGLMLIYDKAKKENNFMKTSYLYRGLKFSSQFETHIKYIALVIAQHNLWRASEDSINEYKEFKLNELIENGLGNSKVKLDSKSNLLFLLGMIDTIEPLKVLKSSTRDALSIIKSLSLDVIKSNELNSEDNKTDIMKLNFEGDENDIKKLSKSIKEMGKWISIDIIKEKDKRRVGFQVKEENNKVVFKEIGD